MTVEAVDNRVFLASRNVKKLAEMQRILTEHAPDVVVLGLDDLASYDEPVEDQPSFEGNALLKAHAAVAATGLPSLADDSGLCVDALNGMPGVLSARWSGSPPPGPKDRADDRNNQLVLAQLADVPEERRGAHFVCAVAFCYPIGEGGVAEHVVRGRMDGRVIRETRGTGGFGYDALFAASGYDLTTAELSVAEKDAISHRGRAVAAAMPRLRELLEAADTMQAPEEPA